MSIVLNGVKLLLRPLKSRHQNFGTVVANKNAVPKALLIVIFTNTCYDICLNCMVSTYRSSHGPSRNLRDSTPSTNTRPSDSPSNERKANSFL